MVEAVVLLPGILCDDRVFAHQASGLEQGRTVCVRTPKSGQKVEEMAEDLLADLPERFALAGQGLGGNIALEILKRAPERVSRLGLISTCLLSETPMAAALREERIVRARVGRMEDVLASEIQPKTLAPGSGRLAVLNMLGQMALDLGPELFIRQSRAMQRKRDQHDLLRRCTVPTAVICGSDDGLTPRRRFDLMAHLAPCAKLHEIPNAGHLPSLEQPEATLAALESWLEMPLRLH